MAVTNWQWAVVVLAVAGAVLFAARALVRFLSAAGGGRSGCSSCPVAECSGDGPASVSTPGGQCGTIRQTEAQRASLAAAGRWSAEKKTAVKRIHVVGKKNSGKTALIVALVEHLTGRGHRVATVKHTHHRHELDTPGKDSYLHRQAGAAAVGIVSADMSALYWPAGADDDPASRYDQFAGLLADCDLVLVEGHSQAEAVKIEVWRAAVSRTPMASADHSIIALVTDDPVEVAVPVWPRSDVAEVAARLLDLVRSGV